MNKEVKAFFRGDKACKPYMHTYVKKYNTTVKKGLTFLSEGKYGAVYSGCIDDACEKKIAIKITKEPTAKMEYKIADKLKGFNVPNMYHFKSCKDGKDVLFFEYIDGKTLNEFLKVPVSHDVYRSIMVQVLYNLYRIQKKFPSFRHHDLHGGNIIIRRVPIGDVKISVPGTTPYTVSNAGVEPVIIDFGFSTITGIKNPLVESEERKNIGIYKKSPKSYDVHYFLITMFSIVNPPSNEVQSYVRSFLTKLLPPSYLAVESNKLKNMRLRGNMGANHAKNVPTLEQILTNPFFMAKKPSNSKTAMNKVKEILARTKVNGPQKKPLKPKTAPSHFSMDANGDLKIGSRKCRLYTKDQLCTIIKNLTIK